MVKMRHRKHAVNERGYRINQDHQRAKLTNHEVDLVIELAESGMSYRKIAAKFEISFGTVSDYVSCRRRAQIPDFDYVSKTKPVESGFGELVV